MYRYSLWLEICHSHHHVLQVGESRRSNELVQKLVKLVELAKVYNTINGHFMSSCWAISSMSHRHTKFII
jgi:hypothetical protein